LYVGRNTIIPKEGEPGCRNLTKKLLGLPYEEKRERPLHTRVMNFLVEGESIRGVVQRAAGEFLHSRGSVQDSIRHKGGAIRGGYIRRRASIPEIPFKLKKCSTISS